MKIIDGKPYREVRCNACHALICYEYIFAGRIAIDNCPKCGEKSVFTYKHIKTTNNVEVIDKEFTEVQNCKETD